MQHKICVPNVSCLQTFTGSYQKWDFGGKKAQQFEYFNKQKDVLRNYELGVVVIYTFNSRLISAKREASLVYIVSSSPARDT